MKLYVNGQDISQITVGSVDTGILITKHVETEAFLSVINAFVREQAGSYDNLEAIYVVVGPGSATALRSTLSILQTMHFVEGVSLYALQKDPEEEDGQTLKRAVDDAQAVETLIPVYQHSPRITISNKDALGRITSSLTSNS